MNQRSLFESSAVPRREDGGAHAVARKDDPISSVEAAKKMNLGTAKTHEGKVIAALKIKDGQTGYEIAAATGLPQVECIRRLSGMSNRKHNRPIMVEARDSDVRCRIKPQSKQSRWWLIRGAK